jgi:transposase
MLNKKKRPTFSPEFCRESAQLVLDQGYLVAKAAHAMTPDQLKIRELKKRLKQIDLETEILKRQPLS